MTRSASDLYPHTYECADHAEAILEGLAEQEPIHVENTAIMSWPATRKSSGPHRLSSLTGPLVDGSALWGCWSHRDRRGRSARIKV